jgi:hypothetical protein
VVPTENHEGGSDQSASFENAQARGFSLHGISGCLRLSKTETVNFVFR